jgi:hypothetical protein
MPATFKRLLLRAVEKQPSLRRKPDGTVYADENETIFETTDRRALILAIRGKGTMEPEELREVVKMAHEATHKDVVGIFLGEDHDLEVYEVSEEAPDALDQIRDEEVLG